MSLPTATPAGNAQYLELVVGHLRDEKNTVAFRDVSLCSDTTINPCHVLRFT
jgi:hypothetical protein